MFHRISNLLVTVLLGMPVVAQEGTKIDRFGPLRFLAGTWRGDQAGQPGQGTAERSYQFILDDRFLQETNTSTEFTERFEIAEPGKDFELYSEAHLRRVR